MCAWKLVAGTTANTAIVRQILTNMKTFRTLLTLVITTALFALVVSVRADDKDKDKNSVSKSTSTSANLDKAKQTVRNISQSEVKGSTSTANAQQIAKEQNAVEQAHQKEVSQKAAR